MKQTPEIFDDRIDTHRDGRRTGRCVTDEVRNAGDDAGVHVVVDFGDGLGEQGHLPTGQDLGPGKVRAGPLVDLVGKSANIGVTDDAKDPVLRHSELELKTRREGQEIEEGERDKTDNRVNNAS